MDTQHNLLKQQIAAIRHLATTELYRTHEQHGQPGDRLILACRSCQTRFPEQPLGMLPAPATMQHAEDCIWLIAWLELPADLRDDYLKRWRHQKLTAKRLSAPTFIPHRLTYAL